MFTQVKRAKTLQCYGTKILVLIRPNFCCEFLKLVQILEVREVMHDIFLVVLIQLTVFPKTSPSFYQHPPF